MIEDVDIDSGQTGEQEPERHKRHGVNAADGGGHLRAESDTFPRRLVPEHGVPELLRRRRNQNGQQETE